MSSPPPHASPADPPPTLPDGGGSSDVATDDNSAAASAAGDHLHPGTADDVHGKCACCETVVSLASLQAADPDGQLWEASCPECAEGLFMWACMVCANTCAGYYSGPYDPSFREQQCCECGRSEVDLEAEEAQQKRYTEQKPECFALRLADRVWDSLRPLVVAELAEYGAELDVRWCEAQRAFFDRSWAELHESRIMAAQDYAMRSLSACGAAGCGAGGAAGGGAGGGAGGAAGAQCLLPADYRTLECEFLWSALGDPMQMPSNFRANQRAWWDPVRGLVDVTDPRAAKAVQLAFRQPHGGEITTSMRPGSSLLNVVATTLSHSDLWDAAHSPVAPRVHLRALRENHDESMATWPTAGTPQIQRGSEEQRRGREWLPEAVQLSWSSPPQDDPREVWRGDTELTFPLVLLWQARVGGLVDGEYNEKWVSATGTPHLYCPVHFVGAPRSADEQVAQGFPNCFWMRGASAESIKVWRTAARGCRVCFWPREECRRLSDDSKEESSTEESAGSGSTEGASGDTSAAAAGTPMLQACSCRAVTYCGKQCQRRDWARHKKREHGML